MANAAKKKIVLHANGSNGSSPKKQESIGKKNNEDDDGSSSKRHRKNPNNGTKNMEGVEQSSSSSTSASANTNSSPKPKMKGGSKHKQQLNGTVNSTADAEQTIVQKKNSGANTDSATTENGGSPKKKSKKKKKTSTKDTTQSNQSPADDESKSPTSKAVATQHDNGTTKSNKSSPTKSTSTKSTSTNPSSPKLKIARIPPQSQMSTLQKSFLARLTSSRFRELNETLYTHSSQHSLEKFSNNPELFDQYHVGFRKQVKEWPVNPVDVIYRKICREYNGGKIGGGGGCDDDDDGGGGGGDKGSGGTAKNKDGKKNNKEQVVIADFGCGDAKLAERLLSLTISGDGQSLTQASSSSSTAGKKKKNKKIDPDQLLCPFKVHSFDLVSGGNPLVTPADMSNVPLPNEVLDVGVYSLALMGTNVADFVREAWRVLKFNGVLRVAEVRSRFETAAEQTAAGGKEMSGGKRGKLNNGKKFMKKNKGQQNNNNKKQQQHNNANNNNDNDESSPPQPLMLLDEFLSLMERCGFQCTNMDRNTNKMFLFMDFRKVDGSLGLSEKERFTAKPCIYKRR